MSYIQYSAAIGFYVDIASTLNVLSDSTEETLSNGDLIPDQSPVPLNLTVTGSLGKASATGGSESVGFSGWSAVNYASRAYDSSFDVGIGDFTIRGWYKVAADGWYNIVHRGGATAANNDAGASFSVTLRDNGEISLVINTAITITMDSYTDGAWHHFAFSRKSGILQAFSDGNLMGFVDITAVSILSVSNAELLYIGRRASTTYPNAFTGGSCAGISFEPVGKTPPQLGEIYGYEKAMFLKYSAFSFLGRNYAFDVGISAYSPSFDIRKTTNVSLGNTAREIIVTSEQEKHAVSTLGYPINGGFRRVKNFLQSTNRGEEFIFDLFGSSAQENDPLNVWRDDKSPKMKLIGIDNMSASFRMVEL